MLACLAQLVDPGHPFTHMSLHLFGTGAIHLAAMKNLMAEKFVVKYDEWIAATRTKREKKFLFASLMKLLVDHAGIIELFIQEVR